MAQYSTTNAPLPWMEPYLQEYMGRAQEVANTPYQQSPGTYAGPNSMLTGGWQAVANRASQGSPLMGAANTELQKNITGGYLDPNSNPYLSNYVNQAQQDTVNNYNMVKKPAWDTTMQRSGSFGNSGVSEYAAMDASNLQKNLGQMANTAYMGAYDRDRQAQQAATMAAPQFANQDYRDIQELLNAGQQAQGFDAARQGQNQQWWQESQMYPQGRLDAYGRALGVGGGGVQTQTSPDPSTASQLIGGGMTGLALYNMLFGKPPGE